MRLEPQKNFPVTRTLDPLDTDTNYVRALVYYLKSDNTETPIATVDLDNTSGQRFLKFWRTRAQAAAEGDWVRIETRVYTDATYNTENENYREESNTHLIKREIRNIGFGGGSAGPGFDYKRIKELIENALKKNKAKASKVVVNPTPVTVKLTPVTEVLNKVVKAIEKGNITTAEQKEKLAILITSVATEFLGVNKKIDGLPELPDLKPLMKSADSIDKNSGEIDKESKKIVKKVEEVEKLANRFNTFVSDVAKSSKQMELTWNIIKENLESRDDVLSQDLDPLVKQFEIFSERIENYIYDNEDLQ